MMTYIKLGVAIFAAALLTFTHIYVYNAGKELVLSRLKDDRIEVLKDGKKIDTEALAADDDQLCALLGGCELSDDINN